MVKVLKQFLILFAVLALFVSLSVSFKIFTAPPTRCGPNEQFTTCGSACPVRCGRRQPDVCTLQCIVGCQCKGGYARNDNGDFPFSQVCGPNSQFHSCGSGCPLICGQPRPQVCTAQCIAGCQCKPGYARNDKGDSPPTQECGENQEFTTCGTACPLSCAKQSPGICTLQCVIGCQCKEGYVLNDKGACVQTKDC
ncbi:serine protease inhibitor swm-1-like [Musca vetustissima]|uniref:serine protease inhibitor swm-1-like n=1 Tax=Musca vetustissima TaxID=27455 RepID=UPI002AB5E1C5|nr:serine protease inhibitor swm-1-like [Musca vetustissima]